MNRASLFVLFFLALTVTGCGEGPARVQGERPEETASLALTQAGDAALDQQRFADARESYVKALALAPNDPQLHYRLGVALTHLNEHREAEKSFEQVLRLTGNQGKEAEAAREWLLARGVVPRARAAEDQITKTSAPSLSSPEDPVKPVDATRDPGSIVGQVSWVLPDGRAELISGRSVELYSVDHPEKRLAWKVTDKEGRFRFDGLSPGSYRLRAFYAGPAPLWNVTVRVDPNQETNITLTKVNSVASGNDSSKRDQ